jgi:RNA polymerase sigma-70 factor (ECF subfamily)
LSHGAAELRAGQRPLAAGAPPGRAGRLDDPARIGLRSAEHAMDLPPDNSFAEVLAVARAAWPGVELADAEILVVLRNAAETASGGLAGICVADLYLAQACARGDARALAIFDEAFLSAVPAILARHPARADADEIRQRVRERLLVAAGDEPPRIARYGGRGPLAGWLRVATLRVASNLRRGDREHDELPAELAEAVADAPELRMLAERYQAAFRQAFRHAFAALAAEERMILRLHHVDGVTVRRLAPLLGVSAATAGRRITAAQHALAGQLLSALAAAVGAAPDEVASAVRALLSRLDVSLSALVGDDA